MDPRDDLIEELDEEPEDLEPDDYPWWKENEDRERYWGLI